MTNEHVPVRNSIIAALRRDVIGPGWIPGSEKPNLGEVLDLKGSNPTRRYLTGYLEPRRSMESTATIPVPTGRSSKETDELVSGSPEELDNTLEDSTEGELLLSPSSMGLTFATDLSEVDLNVHWGTY